MKVIIGGFRSRPNSVVQIEHRSKDFIAAAEVMLTKSAGEFDEVKIA